jgi:hypothetical protein
MLIYQGLLSFCAVFWFNVILRFQTLGDKGFYRRKPQENKNLKKQSIY